MNKIAHVIVVYICAISLMFVHTMPVYAGIVETNELLHDYHTEYQKEYLYQVIDREDARNLLEQHGVSAEQAQERINAMTNEEVQMLSQHFENLPAAGSVGTAAAILILILLVLVLALR